MSGKRSQALKGAFIQDVAFSPDSGDVSLHAGVIYFPVDTVVDRIEINDDATTNVLTDYIKTSDGTALKGSQIATANGSYFSFISYTSGTINPANT